MAQTTETNNQELKNPKQVIQKTLQDLAEKHQVKIIYASEAGSRAWGYPSPDSDYDVHFIYVHPLEWYLTINVENKKDTIQYISDDRGQVTGIENSWALDFVGWDLRKACKLLAKSNPAIFECLYSPIVYVSCMTVDKIKKIAEQCYSRKASYYHYYNLARNTQRYLSDILVKPKKYLSMLRPLMAVNWICHETDMVPTKFEILYTHPTIPASVQTEIQKLIEIKSYRQSSKVDLYVPHNQIIDDYVKDWLSFDEKLEFPKFSIDLEIINELFQSIVLSTNL